MLICMHPRLSVSQTGWNNGLIKIR